MNVIFKLSLIVSLLFFWYINLKKYLWLIKKKINVLFFIIFYDDVPLAILLGRSIIKRKKII